MAINKDCFIADIQTEVDNLTSSCDEREFMKTALSSCGVSDNVQSYVASGSSLPDLFFDVVPYGTIFYIEDIGVPVFAGSDFKWYGIDGRLYRNDTPVRQVYAWGCNLSGQIGDETKIFRSSPVQEISSSTNWCQVSTSCNSLAIKTNGELWGWGANVCGTLANGTVANTSSPVQEITSSTNWCQVSSSNHGIAIKTSGQIWGWGFNLQGSIGDGTNFSKCSPVQEISSSVDWCQASASGFYTNAIKTSGTLWSWGYNVSGRLGDGTTITRSSPVQEISSSTNWCQVDNGSSHSLAIKTSGELWSWGGNGSGSMGDGTTITRSSPVQEISSSVDWCQTSAGAYSIAIKSSGQIWSWGNNFTGTIGDGTTISRSSPVQEISSSVDWCQASAGVHSHAIKTSGTLWGWGCNTFGHLSDGTIINRSSPVQEVSLSTNWCQVSNKSANAVAIKVS